MSLAPFVWPASRLAGGVALLARAAGFGELGGAAGAGVAPGDPARIGGWLEALVTGGGAESEAVRCTYGETAAFLRRAGPAVLRVQGPPGASTGFLLMLGRRRGRVLLVRADGELAAVAPEAVHAELWADVERAFAPAVDRMLDRAALRPGRRARVRTRLLGEHLAERALEGAWILRLEPGADAWAQARRARVPARLALAALAHAAVWGLVVAAWVAIGRGALAGSVEAAWVGAWVLLLLSGIPLRVAESWLQGSFALDVGALFKRRLLVGALKLRTEETRHQGVGQLLGRVLESETVETLALGAGFVATAALVELGLATWVLAQGAGPALTPLLLLVWVGLALALGRTAFRRGRAWTRARLALTHDLVERMVGHRTRQVQEARERWHDGEDELLEAYMHASGRLDRATVALATGLGSLWLAIGVVGLAPAFLSGDVTATSLAVGLGGLLLAQQAVTKLAASVAQLATLRVAWGEVRELHRAAARYEPRGDVGLAAAPASLASGGEDDAVPLLAARGLGLRYPGRAEPAIEGCDLRIEAGDRVLLEGPSGGGKSTLAALVTGLREPSSGLLLLSGLDRASWGARAWRRRVSAAPQSHENHVFEGTLAFNLLLARGWPPSDKDLAEAHEVCVALGLGPLLERMPTGLFQTVGETGWQLSHGERARVFVARALLQEGDLKVFDESFAALDPGTLRRVVECVLERSPTAVVVAHP
ncbi:MAG: ABC transporter ATP-binding protein [Planctomycetota bacterium]